MAIRGKARSHGQYVNGRESYIHQAWRAMILRCHDPKNASYKNYGGRRISVCHRWRPSDNLNEGFAAFLADMGERPSPDHSIDRIDNDAGYSPENCRWATRKQQGRNRGTCRTISLHGELVPIIVAAEKTGLTHAVISQRLNMGWSGEEAVSRPTSKRAPFKKYVCDIGGEKLTTRAASLRYGISVALLRKRLNLGMTGERLIAPSARPYRFKP